MNRRTGGGVMMETFNLDPRRWWLARLLGRNPLLRTADRIEALVIVCAAMVSLLAIPVAGTVGTATYDARHRVYVHEAQTRHLVTATVTDTGVSDTGAVDAPAAATISVEVAWQDGNGNRTGRIERTDPVKIGDRVQMWVDDSGNQTLPPTPMSRAAREAILLGFAMWYGVVIPAALLVTVARNRLNRVRYAEWDREIESFADDGGRDNRG
jgi:hypothetical protein